MRREAAGIREAEMMREDEHEGASGDKITKPPPNGRERWKARSELRKPREAKDHHITMEGW